MAVNSNISIGRGIGLQGQPEMYENIAMEQLRYKRKKEEEEKNKQKELLDKYRGSLNVTGYDPIYNSQIAGASAKVIDQLNKAQSEKRLNTIESDPNFRRDMAEFQLLAGNAKLKSQAIAQYEKEASDAANIGKIAPNKELFDTLNAARTQGDVTPELAKYFGQGGMGVDPNKFYTPIEKELNFQEEVAKVLSPFAQRQAKEGGNAYYDEARGMIVTPRTKTYTQQEAESVIEGYLQNPDWAKQAVKDFNKLSAEEKQTYGDPVTFYKQKFAPQLVIEDATTSLSKPGDGAGISNKELQEVVKNSTETVLSGGTRRQNYGKFAIAEPIRGGALTMPSGTIDITTNKPVIAASTDKDISYESPAISPVWTQDSPWGKKGTFVSREARIAIANQKRDWSDYYEFKPIADVSYKKVVEEKDASGKPVYVIDDMGNQVVKTKDVESSVAVPLKTVEGVYSSRGLKLDPYYKQASDFNKNAEAKKRALSEGVPTNLANEPENPKGFGVSKDSSKSTIPAASKQAWLNNGWTEDGIKKAVKEGKIKVL